MSQGKIKLKKIHRKWIKESSSLIVSELGSLKVNGSFFKVSEKSNFEVCIRTLVPINFTKNILNNY